jgi:hypothetical protein
LISVLKAVSRRTLDEIHLPATLTIGFCHSSALRPIVRDNSLLPVEHAKMLQAELINIVFDFAAALKSSFSGGSTTVHGVKQQKSVKGVATCIIIVIGV